MCIRDSQKDERTHNETIEALIYIDLICCLFRPEVSPAKIGISDSGLVAININRKLCIKVSNRVLCIKEENIIKY